MHAEGITPADQAVAAQLMAAEAAPLLIALNKCDAVVGRGKSSALPAQVFGSRGGRRGRSWRSRRRPGPGWRRWRLRWCGPTRASESDAAESVIVTAARHALALEAAHQALEHALQTTRARLPGDFIAIDVRGALDALGEITGETVTEEIVHRIFQDFCVGK